MDWVARSRVLSTVFVFALAVSLPVTASAHVKWFSNFSFADRPRTWQEALTPTTWALMALSMLALGVLVFLERRMAKSRWGSLIDKLLEPYKKQSLLVMRIGIAATLLLAWNQDAMADRVLILQFLFDLHETKERIACWPMCDPLRLALPGIPAATPTTESQQRTKCVLLAWPTSCFRSKMWTATRSGCSPGGKSQQCCDANDVLGSILCGRSLRLIIRWLT
jgi:hypothetical protein